MRAAWTAVAILVALAVQTVLGLVSPAAARAFDPFLLVVVYCALTGGEAHGLLAGTAAGWVQDSQWSSGVVGLSGLTKCLVGFAVGVASTRFHLGAPSARLLVLLIAGAADAVLFLRLGALFGIQMHEPTPAMLAVRTVIGAAVGLALFEGVDRRLSPEARRDPRMQ